MTHVIGIDIGSTYTKVIIIDGDRRVVARGLAPTGFDLPKALAAARADALSTAGLRLEDLDYVACTGYGRHMVEGRDIAITELTCHARGAAHLFPAVRTILDIGGQDIKAIRLDDHHRVRMFRLNDKCAAGTGKFLERTARYLGHSTADVAPLAEASEHPTTISSVCTVFAESEVINHLSRGEKQEDIMNGAVIALAGRAVQLMKRVGMAPEYALTGGMTRNKAMIRAVEAALGAKVHIPPHDLGQFNGALGAALLGLSRLSSGGARAVHDGDAVGDSEAALSPAAERETA
jgi:predicted CoA-substrate-specific enzyme activase